jgi:3-oxoadipate enol-lactonase
MVALAYTVDGEAGSPTLVLGSALGTTGAIWQSQIPVLSRHFRVVRYDHRGHGASPVPPGPYRIEDLGNDLVALLDQLAVSTVHLGGISIGSAVAAWVAAHHPSRVDRLVLAGTAARMGTPESWQQRLDAISAAGMAAVASTVVDRWLPPSFDATARQALLDQVLATPVAGYAACCSALSIMDLSADLTSITAPTLVIAGSVDTSTAPELGQGVAASIPGARFEVIEGAAHLSNISHAETFTRLVEDFLS